jgi:membrane protein YqaA with SNARE-associated domain
LKPSWNSIGGSCRPRYSPLWFDSVQFGAGDWCISNQDTASTSLSAQSVVIKMVEPLLDWRAWAFIIFQSAISLVGSVAKYKLCQTRMPKVKEKLSHISAEKWEQVEGWFQHWDAPSLLLASIPGLGTLLLPLAGANGTKIIILIFWIFMGKFIRDWLIFYRLFLGVRVVIRSGSQIEAK